MKFKGKFVVVTGASIGIGRAIAVEFGRQKATVGLIARREDELEKTRKLVEKAGGIANIFSADLSKTESVDNLIKKIQAKFEVIDVLVNVAGIWHGSDHTYTGIDFSKFETQVILDTMNVGLIAPMLLIHGLSGRIKEGGVILNLSGTFIYGAKGQVPYYVSKRAMEDLTIALSEDLADKNIYVNCISPSDTSTTALQKYFPQDAYDANTPEQVAKLAVDICSQKTTGKFWKIKHGKITLDGYHK